MNPIIAASIAAILNGAIEIWRTHSNRPAGWKPTEQDIQSLNDLIDQSTPGHIKALAASRLGIPWPPSQNP